MRLTLLTLLPLLGCATTPGADTSEPTDRDTDSGDPVVIDDADDPEHAVVIDFDEEIADNLHDTDVDWYKITGTAGKPFRVQVVNDDENVDEDALDTLVSVYDSAMTLIAEEDEHPIGDVGTYDSVCFGFFPTSGDYYIAVQDVRTAQGLANNVGTTNYTIEALAPSSVPAETDSLLSAGKDVTFGDETDNLWFAVPVLSERVGDTDFVKLNLAHDGGALFFAVDPHVYSSPYQAEIEVYNADADLVLSASSALPEDGRTLISTPGSSYVLAMQDASGGSGDADGAWVFVLDTEAGYGNPYEVEPNDDAASAPPLTLEAKDPDAGFWYAAYGEGRISPAGDEDWFPFTSPEEGYITVAFGGATYGSLLQASVEVYSGDTLVASGLTTGGVDPHVVTDAKVPAGDYTLRVRAQDGTPTGEGAYYRLSVNVASVAL